MKLRRPNLEDKDAILEMIAEFDAANSYMHGGVGSTWKRAKNYEDWLKIVEQQEDAENLPEGWVPATKEPIMTQLPPAAKAFTTSPECFRER